MSETLHAPTPAVPHHRLSVDARIGPLHLHAQIDLTAPWTVIFGPSGSGKSSILHAACGLLEPAIIDFSERDGSDAAWREIEGSRHKIPPHMRSIAYAPQGAVLFPHLTVRENVAFASAARRARVANTHLIEESIELFDLTALANRMPRDLSGGERQRVNLARAFALPTPRLMLLDEPFTGVDRALRETLLPRMQQRLAQRGVPVLSVTHDVEEALLLKAEVLRLNAGQIIAQGPAAEILATERIQMLKTLLPES